ncbi:TetR/AcrR family transcriptional regulator [uncultured Mycolicibacterium sp.]|uniref:TetR/AcrR family transcriptional regulator n=1 Tax=uncultured Mycolicibacterium sp. TaxID=2320817 RepID=UPI002603EA44|nr:helix-turn-helix domain-containing protein [uncultured Mycolicibacterium sp.]
MPRRLGRNSTPSANSEPAEDRGETRAEEMARAAADLFQRFGFQNVSIERIGAAVGLTGPAVYRHFKGKHDILAHALMNQGELAERICRRTDEQGGTPRRSCGCCCPGSAR